MRYGLGDRVRIITKNQPGSICDGPNVDGETGKVWYIVDCAGECGSWNPEDCVVDVMEDEIEPLLE